MGRPRRRQHHGLPDPAPEAHRGGGHPAGVHRGHTGHHLHGNERHGGSAARLPGQGHQRGRRRPRLQLRRPDAVAGVGRCSPSLKDKGAPQGPPFSPVLGTAASGISLSPLGRVTLGRDDNSCTHAGRDRPLHRVHLALDLRQHPQFPGDFPARGLPHKQNPPSGDGTIGRGSRTGSPRASQDRNSTRSGCLIAQPGLSFEGNSPGCAVQYQPDIMLRTEASPP